MFMQDVGSNLPVPATNESPGERVILDWIAAWQPVREDVIQLMAAYHQADDGHDISSFLPLIDEVDATMRLLHHRVDWLRRYLGHVVEVPIDRP
jgi:hypothetical protein